MTHHHGPAGEDDPAPMAELLDLEGEVFHGYLSDVTGWARELAGDLPHGRVLDLGAGTGTGTVALARRFPEAEVTALDMLAGMLDRLRHRVGQLGLAGRVRPVEADLDTAWPDIGSFDLVWASNSMHHLADPRRVLTEVFAAVYPGGLLVVAEMEGFSRLLPDDLNVGRPGLAARCDAAVAERMAEHLPHLGADWRAHLHDAGFTVEAERRFVVEVTPPLAGAGARYAQALLQRLRAAVDGVVGADDQAALDALVDGDGPDAVRRRDHLAVRAERTVWVARRP